MENEPTKFTTRCGRWSFEAVQASTMHYPFPTNPDIRGANPEPICVAVKDREDPFGPGMHIYVQSGDGDTCLEIAEALADAQGPFKDKRAHLGHSDDERFSARLIDWLPLLQDRRHRWGALLGA